MGDEKKPSVTISWETAEYLSVLVGQTLWGSRSRRRKAGAELGEAMRGHTMDRSQECFNEKK